MRLPVWHCQPRMWCGRSWEICQHLAASKKKIYIIELGTQVTMKAIMDVKIFNKNFHQISASQYWIPKITNNYTQMNRPLPSMGSLVANNENHKKLCFLIQQPENERTSHFFFNYVCVGLHMYEYWIVSISQKEIQITVLLWVNPHMKIPTKCKFGFLKTIQCMQCSCFEGGSGHLIDTCLL